MVAQSLLYAGVGVSGKIVGEGAEEIVLSISYKRCSCAESSIGGDTGALGASQYGAAVSW